MHLLEIHLARPPLFLMKLFPGNKPFTEFSLHFLLEHGVIVCHQKPRNSQDCKILAVLLAKSLLTSQCLEIKMLPLSAIKHKYLSMLCESVRLTRLSVCGCACVCLIRFRFSVSARWPTEAMAFSYPPTGKGGFCLFVPQRNVQNLQSTA